MTFSSNCLDAHIHAQHLRSPPREWNEWFENIDSTKSNTSIWKHIKDKLIYNIWKKLIVMFFSVDNVAL